MKAFKKFLIALLAILALTAGYFVLKGPFLRWRARRLAAIAGTLMNQGDRLGAALTARTILQGDAWNIEASGILARCAEEDRSPLALFWRQRLVELQPGKAGPLLDLARAATALGESAVAENALNQVPAGERNSAAFHDAEAGWALSLRQYGAAEEQEAEALRLDPENPRLRLSLASLKLVTGDPAASAGARADLETLRQDPQVREEATRALLADAQRRRDTAAALQLARALDAAPEARTGDHLLLLDELQREGSPAFESKLSTLQAGATDPGAVFAIMDWMNGHGLAARTLAWCRALPAASAKMPVPLALADACIAAGDWISLEGLVHGAQWGELDFLRLAYEARWYDETSQHDRGTDFKDRWQRAVFSAGGNPNAVAMLARMVRAWGWKEQAAELWWSLASRRAGQRPALTALYEMGMEDRDTPELFAVSRRIYEVEPASPVAKNNVAMFALLLRRDMAAAHKLAEEDFRALPSQPAIASTYAFSLYLQGRIAEAVAVMAQLPPVALDDPSTAACNGVLLRAAGQAEKARPYLELAEREKARLFPEETKMVELALSQP